MASLLRANPLRSTLYSGIPFHPPLDSHVLHLSDPSRHCSRLFAHAVPRSPIAKSNCYLNCASCLLDDAKRELLTLSYGRNFPADYGIFGGERIQERSSGQRFSKAKLAVGRISAFDGEKFDNLRSDNAAKSKSLFRSVILRVLPSVVLTFLIVSLKPSNAIAAASAQHTESVTAEAMKELAPHVELINSAWTGLAAGWLHTLSGPDHLAALAPLSIGRTKLQSASVGALWGCGHNTGQIIFGLIFLLLKDKLHLDLLRTWGSRIVGLTLLVIGGMGIKEAQHTPIQCHPDDEACLAQPGAVAIEVNAGKFGIATFATGIVHGLQPDALLVILPALALPSKLAGAAFLSMFLIGTIIAMGSYTAFIGSCSEALNNKVPWLTRRLSTIASSIAIIVGMFIILGDLLGRKLF